MSQVIITSAFNLDNETQDYLVLLNAKDQRAIDAAKAFLKANKSGVGITLTSSSQVLSLDDCDVLSAGQLETIREYEPVYLLEAHRKPYVEASKKVDYPKIIRVQARKKGYVVDIGIGEDIDSMAWCTLEEV